ncbi:MAG: hypothetical protein HDR88_11660 [Bacteroides sp.]|nr:hypothetical protein [Bacteroides sp.]
MNYLLKLLLLSSVVSSYMLPIEAQSSASTTIQDIPKKAVEDKTHPPRMPSHESIGFMYQNGECYFSMPDYVTYIDVTLESETVEVYSSCVYASTPVWVLTLASGKYEITCESDEGSYFAGCSYNCKFYI